MGTVVRAWVLLLGGAAAGLLSNALRPGGVHLQPTAAPIACESNEAPAPLITSAEASALCGRSDVVVADARPAARYAEGHVAGAVHLPCDATGAVAADTIARFAGVRTLVVYGQDTADAAPVAAALQRRIHADVRVLAGGFAAWDRAGLACASGPCDECSTGAHK